MQILGFFGKGFLKGQRSWYVWCAASFPGSISKKLRSSWRLLFALREICDKEPINQLSPEGVGAKNNTELQQSTKEALRPMPGAALALGGCDQQIPDELSMAGLHLDGFIMGKSELKAGL